MKSRSLFASFAIVALTLTHYCAVAAAKPNILFIYNDDHSYRTISC